MSSNGTRMVIVKLANGATDVRSLLVGVMYGSAGLTMTLLAIGVAGGNENTLHFVLSVSAEAIEARRVVIAGIAYPIMDEGDRNGLKSPRTLAMS